MKILSIRQPWAWAIINAGKDIENRNWTTKVRGRVLVHASVKHAGLEASLSMFDILRILRWAEDDIRDRLISPAAECGGIVGSVEITDCVEKSDSPWFFGRYGFVLRDPKPVPFIPLKGRLGFWDAPAEVVAQIGGAS